MNNESSKVATAVVVGAGIVGRACALNLQSAGIRTILAGPASLDAASWGNAGHIAVEQVEPLASFATIRSVPRRLFRNGGAVALPPRDIGAWLPFSLRLLAASRGARFRAGTAALTGALGAALPAWRRLLDLAEAPDLLREEGHFVVWETPASAAAGRARWHAASIGATSFRDASAAELDMLSRHLARPPAGAIRFSGSGQIADLPALAQVLEQRFLAIGGERRTMQVRSIEASSGGAAIRLDDGETITADAVAIAAGVASAGLLEPIGHRVPIIAERGYHIQSAATDWPDDMPPVAFEDRSLFVTRFRSGLRATSFVEFGRRDGPPDPAKWARLRAHAAALGLPFAEPVTQWMGSRPTLPDYLPAIGRSRRLPGLYYAFGHQHLGLTLAAATGEAMAALVTGEAPPFDLAPFDLERFG